VNDEDAFYADGHLYFVSRLQISTITSVLKSINGVHYKYLANCAMKFLLIVVILLQIRLAITA
jgi:hypothetical protein